MTALARLSLALFVLLSLGCAGTRTSGPVAASKARTVTLGAAQGALLSQLPPSASFAWVDPITVFTDIEPADGAHSMDAAFAGLRDAPTAVLRANGWRAAPPEEAQFHLALAVVDRPTTIVRYQPDPRNERTPRPVCHIDVRTRERVCYTPPSPRYPPLRSSVAATDRRVGFAIRRSGDGAIRWWILDNVPQADAERLVARRTLELLLVEDP